MGRFEPSPKVAGGQNEYMFLYLLFMVEHNGSTLLWMSWKHCMTSEINTFVWAAKKGHQHKEPIQHTSFKNALSLCLCYFVEFSLCFTTLFSGTAWWNHVEGNETHKSVYTYSVWMVIYSLHYSFVFQVS